VTEQFFHQAQILTSPNILNAMRKASYQVVIVGGGISGLTTAFAVMEEAHTHQINVQCTVIEREQRWGGKILTHLTEERLIEGGPDSFLTSKPWAIELCRTLGLQDQLIPTNAEHNHTFSFCRGALRELPQGLLAFRPQRVDALVSSGLLSWTGLLRMGAERFWPRPNPIPPDESMAQFFRRRFGTEAFDSLLEPLVAGIYAGDANELSIEATFPRFRELEREYGSVIKGMRVAQRKTGTVSRSSGGASTLFMTLRNGLGDLILTLVQRLTNRGVRLLSGIGCHEVQLKGQNTEGFHIVLENNDRLSADAVVLATPTFQSAQLLRAFHPEASRLLESIPYTSTATISMAYPAQAIASQIRGFGFVVPRKEQRPLLAATWSSLKWADRCRPEEILIRCYVGGRGREAILEQNDAQLLETVHQELHATVGIVSRPTHAEVYRWIRGMPQYILGHQDRIAKIQHLLLPWPGLSVTGAGFYGLGIPDCIREGTNAGQRLVQTFLQGPAVSQSGTG